MRQHRARNSLSTWDGRAARRHVEVYSCNGYRGKHVVGFNAMRRLAMEVNAGVNEMNRTGGLSPEQWVLGRRPRYSAGEQRDDETVGQLGSLEQRDDSTTIFGERMA